MAFIREIETTSVITNVNNITVALPPHEAGDTIIILVAKDTTAGGDLSTPSGYTKIGVDELQGSNVRSAIYRKYNVSGSESAPNVTNTDNDTWAAIAISIGGVATSGVIGAAVDYNGSHGSVQESDIPGITTTAQNSLVLWLVGSDGSAQALIGDNCRLLNYDDGVGISAIGWANTYSDIGPTGDFKLFSGGTEQYAGFTIEILDGSSGAEVMPYIEGGINSGNTINMLQGIETNSYSPAGVGSGINSAPAVSSVAGINVLASLTLADQADANAVPYARAMRTEADRVSGNAYGITLQVDKSGGGASRDMSDLDSHIYAIIHHNTSKIHSLGGNAADFGTIFILHDTSNNWMAWGVNGRDANRRLESPAGGPVLIHLDSTTNVLDSSGTLNKSAINRLTVAARAELGNNYYTYTCNIHVAEPVVLLGGSPALPATSSTLFDHSRSRQDGTVIAIAEDDTYLLRWVVKVGNGSDFVYSDFQNQTVLFPANEVGTHVKDDYFGLIVNLSPTSTINAQNSLWKSKTPFRFDIQSDNGNIDFSGATISNAETFNIRGNFSSSKLQPAGQLFVSSHGANIDGAVIEGGCFIYGSTVTTFVNLEVTGNLIFRESGVYTIDGGSMGSVANISGGPVTVLLVNGASTVTASPGTGNNQVELINAKAVNFSDVPSGVEIRLRRGIHPVDGIQNVTTGSWQYQYSYSGSDVPITAVFSGEALIESVVFNFFLKDVDQTIPVGDLVTVDISYKQ